MAGIPYRMSEQLTPQYSLTCQTDDEAVYYCLLALWRWAEAAPLDAPLAIDSVDAWRTRGGEFVLSFGNGRARGAFLGEATRLLSGKWLRLGTSDTSGG